MDVPIVKGIVQRKNCTAGGDITHNTKLLDDGFKNLRQVFIHMVLKTQPLFGYKR